MRKRYSAAELAAPERTEVAGTKVCPLFLVLIHGAAKRKGTSLSRLLRKFMREQLTAEERRRVDEVRAGL